MATHSLTNHVWERGGRCVGETPFKRLPSDSYELGQRPFRFKMLSVSLLATSIPTATATAKTNAPITCGTPMPPSPLRRGERLAIFF